MTKKIAVDARITRSINAIKPTDEVLVKVPTTPYNMVGSFGTMTKKNDKVMGVSWEGCRDKFQNVSDSIDYLEFLFCHKAKAANNVIDFIHTVEEVINLKPEDRIVIKKTTNLNIVYIQLTPWWKYRVRRSLLTALLRCGQEYTERTAACFYKALYSQYYTSQTKPAIEQFLKGRTASKLKQKYGFAGWYNLFQGKNENGVRQFLCKLVPKKEKPSEVKKEDDHAA